MTVKRGSGVKSNGQSRVADSYSYQSATGMVVYQSKKELRFPVMCQSRS